MKDPLLQEGLGGLLKALVPTRNQPERPNQPRSFHSMCRLSSEILVTAGGSGIIATVTTFAKVHWDIIKDRKAHKAAKERKGKDQPKG